MTTSQNKVIDACADLSSFLQERGGPADENVRPKESTSRAMKFFRAPARGQTMELYELPIGLCGR